MSPGTRESSRRNSRAFLKRELEFPSDALQSRAKYNFLTSSDVKPLRDQQIYLIACLKERKPFVSSLWGLSVLQNGSTSFRNQEQAAAGVLAVR